MENASKALLIAGGVILVMLIVGLLIFSWTKFSEFYSSNDDLAEIEDLSKFNLQFTNYQDRKVYGYELISLANKVADYNMKYSTEGLNDEKYNPITMTFTIPNDHAESLRFSNTIPNETGTERVISQREKLFKKNLYKQSETENTIIEQIFNEAIRIENIYRGSDYATKLAKSINSLILSERQFEYNRENKKMSDIQSKAASVITFNKIVGNNSSLAIDFDDTNESEIKQAYKDMIKLITEEASIMKYYEYYQFKRGIFKCTNVSYDNITGRVSEIDFSFTGKIE